MALAVFPETATLERTRPPKALIPPPRADQPKVGPPASALATLFLTLPRVNVTSGLPSEASKKIPPPKATPRPPPIAPLALTELPTTSESVRASVPELWKLIPPPLPNPLGFPLTSTELPLMVTAFSVRDPEPAPLMPPPLAGLPELRIRPPPTVTSTSVSVPWVTAKIRK